MVDPESIDEVLGVADALDAGWKRAVERDLSVSRENYMRGMCLLGLATHTTGLMRIVAGLQRDQTNPVTLAMPLVRLGFECGLTSQWLAQVSDGIEAFINNNNLETARLVKNLRASTSTTLNDAAARIEVARIAGQMTSASDHQARVFKELCGDLALAGNDAYAHYQVMCGYSHATVNVADEYLARDETGQAMFTVEPEFSVNPAWLYFSVISTVWAQMAAQTIVPDLGLRAELEATADALGISSNLSLTDAARARSDKRQGRHTP